eukprot:9291089-Prorocentrum_lima.AAC.1
MGSANSAGSVWSDPPPCCARIAAISAVSFDCHSEFEPFRTGGWGVLPVGKVECRADYSCA